MALEEMREAKEQASFSGAELGVMAELITAQTKYTAMLSDLQQQLELLWTKWDTAVDATDPAAQAAAKQAMVALLNRRSYIRNLVRDVNAALE